MEGELQQRDLKNNQPNQPNTRSIMKELQIKDVTSIDIMIRLKISYGPLNAHWSLRPRYMQNIIERRSGNAENLLSTQLNYKS